MPLPSEYREMLEDIEEKYGRLARKKAGTYLMRGMTPEEAMEELRKTGMISSPGPGSPGSHSSNPGPEKRKFLLPGVFPQLFSRVKARNALHRAASHLSHADTALTGAQEELGGLGFDEAVEAIQSIKEELEENNRQISGIIEHIR